MRRFVILKHESDPTTAQRPVHWDLMFEVDRQLRTWSVERYPWDLQQTVSAIELPAHRLDYLDYEGEISNHRGWVERCEAGTYELLERTESKWRVGVTGAVLSGAIILSRLGHDSTWKLEFRRS